MDKSITPLNLSFLLLYNTVLFYYEVENYFLETIQETCDGSQIYLKKSYAAILLVHFDVSLLYLWCAWSSLLCCKN